VNRLCLGALSRLGLLLVPALGCQSRGPEYPDLDTPIERAAPAAASVRETPREPSTLYRDEVSEVVDAGLGLFLKHVEVDAQLEHGTFKGFRILQLAPPEYWHGVDLKPGDVVTLVNGMPIERPFQAHDAFTALKTADRLVVSYLRSGEPRQLSYQIKDRPKPARPVARL
jgi:S1-C subfamily serine protease